MGAKHYWKKNEILYLGELYNQYSGKILAWSKITKDFNAKYSYDLEVEELQKAYALYYGGNNGSRKRNK